MTFETLKLLGCGRNRTPISTTQHLVYGPLRDAMRISPKKDTPPKTLPRVLYMVVLDPTLKFGSMEEQIIHLARAFELQDSVFYPLFICREGGGEGVTFQVAGVETECMDLLSF